MQKASNVADFEFILEGFYDFRARAADYQQSKAELNNKAGDLAALLFMRRYFQYLLKKYPVATCGPGQRKLVDKVTAILQSPRAWLEQCCEVQPCELPWVAGLPEPAQMQKSHARQMVAVRCTASLKGMLGSSPPTGVTP